MNAPTRDRAAEILTSSIRRTLPLLLLALLCFRCDDSLVPYSDERDRAAMQRIERVWTAAGGLDLTLCQHRDESQVQGLIGNAGHVVRKDRAPYKTPREVSTGCGGLPPEEVVAFVSGKIKGPQGEVAVEGYVVLGTVDEIDPYSSIPYGLRLFRAGEQSQYIAGTLGEDGTIALTAWPVELTATAPPGSLSHSGPAACP